MKSVVVTLSFSFVSHFIYLWRNVIPHLEHLGRCIAPDMIGLGDSDFRTVGRVYTSLQPIVTTCLILEQVGATEQVTLGLGLGYQVLVMLNDSPSELKA